jgi:DNA-binding response OmpR family regulator
MHRVILFIEDDRISRRNIAAFMRYSGHEVHEAEDGEAAFELLSSTDFDVVISDLNLPGSINGIEILAAIRRLPRPIKTILITGFGSEEDEIRAALIGATYIRKPLRFEELKRSIEQGAF